jgi:hypothetical protein
MALGDVVVGSGLCNGRTCYYAAAAMSWWLGKKRVLLLCGVHGCTREGNARSCDVERLHCVMRQRQTAEAAACDRLHSHSEV